MIAKLIVFADNREEAIARCVRALEEFYISGVKTTIPIHKFILSHPDFKLGKYDTGYIDNIFDDFLASGAQ